MPKGEIVVIIIDGKIRVCNDGKTRTTKAREEKRQ
jgi:hypothetical protein